MWYNIAVPVIHPVADMYHLPYKLIGNFFWYFWCFPAELLEPAASF